MKELKFGFKKEHILAKTENRKNRIYREISKEILESILNGTELSEGVLELEEEMVIFAIQLIEKELRNLELKNPIEENSDYGKILAHIVFIHDEDNLRASFIEKLRKVEINKRKIENDIDMMSTILHELIHFFAISKVYEREEKGKRKIFVRTGYAEGNKLNFLNEAITEQLTVELIEKQGEIKLKHGYISKEEINSYISNNKTYLSARKMLEQILRYGAKETGFSKEEIWRKIKIGYFRGDMMFLRIFERVYGEGFLSLLANIEHYIKHFDLTAEDLEKIFMDRESLYLFKEKIKECK